MKPKKILLHNNKQQQLVGYLYKNTSKTVVVMCHGISSMIDVPGMDTIFNTYHQTGSSVFVFDFTGSGQSEGSKTISIKQRVADIGTVVDHLSQIYKEIILYGISFSGIVVAIAATKYIKITKLITINGLFTLDLKKLYPRQALATYLYLLFHPLQMSEVYYWKKHFRIEKITIPTLVVYGKSDIIVSPQQSMDFYNGLKTKKKLIAVPHGDHALMKKEYKYATIAIPQWIAQQVV